MAKSQPSPPFPPTVVWREDQPPDDPVSPENPLVGLETLVLQTWLQSSPSLQQQYRKSPLHQAAVQNEVRRRVNRALDDELVLHAQGLPREQAQEFTRPAMWTPPTWPLTETSATPKPEPSSPVTTLSTTPEP